MQDSVKIQFNGEEFEIKKIAIRNMGAVASTLNNLPKVFKELFMQDGNTEVNTETIIDKVPEILMEASDTLPRFLAVAANIDVETVLDGGIDDFFTLTEAVLSVNNLSVIMGFFKRLKGQ